MAAAAAVAAAVAVAAAAAAQIKTQDDHTKLMRSRITTIIYQETRYEVGSFLYIYLFYYRAKLAGSYLKELMSSMTKH